MKPSPVPRVPLLGTCAETTPWFWRVLLPRASALGYVRAPPSGGSKPGWGKTLGVALGDNTDPLPLTAYRCAVAAQGFRPGLRTNAPIRGLKAILPEGGIAGQNAALSLDRHSRCLGQGHGGFVGDSYRHRLASQSTEPFGDLERAKHPEQSRDRWHCRKPSLDIPRCPVGWVANQ